MYAAVSASARKAQKMLKFGIWIVNCLTTKDNLLRWKNLIYPMTGPRPQVPSKPSPLPRLRNEFIRNIELIWLEILILKAKFFKALKPLFVKSAC